MKKTLTIQSQRARRKAKTIHRHTIFLPSLTLSGKWFEKLGFAIGQQVHIIAQGDSLLITKGGRHD